MVDYWTKFEVFMETAAISFGNYEDFLNENWSVPHSIKNSVKSVSFESDQDHNKVTSKIMRICEIFPKVENIKVL